MPISSGFLACRRVMMCPECPGGIFRIRKRGPEPQTPRWSAERRASPDRKGGAGSPRKRPGVPLATARQPVPRKHRRVVSALHSPVVRGGKWKGERKAGEERKK